MKELLTLGFVITYGLSGHTAEENEALRTAARAFYKQSGTERDVNDFVKREVPKGLQTVVGNAAWITKIVNERKIVYTWSF